MILFVFSLDFKYICDGRMDCRDASDEYLCGKVQLPRGYIFKHSDPYRSNFVYNSDY